MLEKITIDGSAANKSAIKSDNKEHGTLIEIRQIKYLNNIVEVRFVDQKPSLNKVWGIGPELKGGDALRLENLIPVSV